jgi:hypothetical protein
VHDAGLNVYIGHEFDSIKSNAHRSLAEMVRSFSGKSNGPQTLITTFLNGHADTTFQRLTDIPKDIQTRLWIPEASIDLWPDFLWKSLDRKSIAVGPSVDVFNPTVLARLKEANHLKILVPSTWVKQLFVEVCGLESSRIHIWAAGVDHEFWKPIDANSFRYLTLYAKSIVANDEMSRIKGFSDELGLELKIVQYGKYKLRDFRELLKHSRALVWAGSTESQGLAQFETWAMNVPTLIRRARNFQNLGIGSESPYLNEQTGQSTKHDSITATDLAKFSTKLDSFHPREWILENATTSIARSKLLSIIDTE